MDERRSERNANFITIRPLQLLGGALFAFLLGAGFDALDRPPLAATFGLLAIATASLIPLESALLKIRPRTRDVRHMSILSFVIGATVTVVIGAWVK